MMTAVAFRRFPPLPTVPEVLRGGSFVALRGCWRGEDLDEGEHRMKPLHEALGEPVIDTLADAARVRHGRGQHGPGRPDRRHQHIRAAARPEPPAIDALVQLGTASPLTMVELRHLGGALPARPWGSLSPMGHSKARFSLNAVGVTPTPEAARLARAYLALPRRRRAAVHDRRRRTSTSSISTGRRPSGCVPPTRTRTGHVWSTIKSRRDPDNVFRYNRNIPPAR